MDSHLDCCNALPGSPGSENTLLSKITWLKSLQIVIYFLVSLKIYTCFAHDVRNLRNELLDDICTVVSLLSFRQKTKIYLSSKAYPRWPCHLACVSDVNLLCLLILFFPLFSLWLIQSIIWWRLSTMKVLSTLLISHMSTYKA